MASCKQAPAPMPAVRGRGRGVAGIRNNRSSHSGGLTFAGGGGGHGSPSAGPPLQKKGLKGPHVGTMARPGIHCNSGWGGGASSLFPTPRPSYWALGAGPTK